MLGFMQVDAGKRSSESVILPAVRLDRILSRPTGKRNSPLDWVAEVFLISPTSLHLGKENVRCIKEGLITQDLDA
jgi:hypothetical protein